MNSEWDMIFCLNTLCHFHLRLEIVLNILHVMYMCIMGCSYHFFGFFERKLVPSVESSL